MLGDAPAVGEIVVVQFGPLDNELTRCEVTAMTEMQIELRPLDRLSGTGARDSAARVMLRKRGRLASLDGVFHEDAQPDKLVFNRDRRVHPRQASTLAIGISQDGDATRVWGHVSDVSVGGLCVRTSVPLHAGRDASFSIASTQYGPIRATGHVVTTTAADNEAAWASHLRFVDLTGADRVRLERIIG